MQVIIKATCSDHFYVPAPCRAVFIHLILKRTLTGGSYLCFTDEMMEIQRLTDSAKVTDVAVGELCLNPGSWILKSVPAAE